MITEEKMEALEITGTRRKTSTDVLQFAGHTLMKTVKTTYDDLKKKKTKKLEHNDDC